MCFIYYHKLKILRIKVDETPYVIPSDNPFYDMDNVKKEIWHYGLRNVWRFSFDKETGDMYLGDVGQNNWEEINFQSSDNIGGMNFGWKILEGTHCYPEDIKDCSSENTELRTGLLMLSKQKLCILFFKRLYSHTVSKSR